MAVDPKSLTVDYKDLLKNTGIGDRASLGKVNDEYKQKLAALSPTDIAKGLKPDYLTKGNMSDAISGDKSRSQSGGGDGGGGGGGGRGRGGGHGHSHGDGNTGRSKVQERQQLSNEQKQTIRDLKDGNIAITDPRADFLNKLDEKGLKAAGIEKVTDRNNTEYRLVPTEKKILSDDEVRERAKGIKSGTEGLEGREKLQKQVFDALKKQNMSDAHAKALTAEIGRENDYNPDTLFGKHTDSGSNRKTNIGMLSWQGKRNEELTARLRDKGLLDAKGNIIRSQEAIDEMAAFIKHEIETKKEYARTKKEFLDNPNITPEQAAEVLGNNYIVWDMKGKYINAEKHKQKRDAYSKKMDAIANKFPDILPPNATPEQLEEARQKIQKIDEDKETDNRFSQVGKLMEEARKDSDPTATADSSTLLKYDRHSDDLKEDNQRLFHQSGKFVASDGTKLDPRLIHMVKEASKDLPPGFRVEMISGADPRGKTKNHPGGLAMDVKIYNDKGEEQPHNRNSPGWKYYEQLHRSTVHRGKELYPDVNTIWGGAWNVSASTPADAMHLQILDTKRVPGSSPGSGAYDFEKGLPKNFRFPDGSSAVGQAMSDEERRAYDKKVLAKMVTERESRIAKSEKTKENKGVISPILETPLKDRDAPTLTQRKDEPDEPDKKEEPKKTAEPAKEEPKSSDDLQKRADALANKTAAAAPADDGPDDKAQGGEIPIENADQVTAVPVPEVKDSGGAENVGIMEGEKMVARVNSKEQLKYDDQRKKIDVTPEHKVKPEQLETRERVNEDDRRTTQENQRQHVQNSLGNHPPYSPDREFINPIVPTDHVLNTSQHRHFERAQHFAGSRHHNHGAVNERGGV